MMNNTQPFQTTKYFTKRNMFSKQHKAQRKQLIDLAGTFVRNKNVVIKSPKIFIDFKLINSPYQLNPTKGAISPDTKSRLMNKTKKLKIKIPKMLIGHRYKIQNFNRTRFLSPPPLWAKIVMPNQKVKMSKKKLLSPLVADTNIWNPRSLSPLRNIDIFSFTPTQMFLPNKVHMKYRYDNIIEEDAILDINSIDKKIREPKNSMLQNFYTRFDVDNTDTSANALYKILNGSTDDKNDTANESFNFKKSDRKVTSKYSEFFHNLVQGQNALKKFPKHQDEIDLRNLLSSYSFGTDSIADDILLNNEDYLLNMANES